MLSVKCDLTRALILIFMVTENMVRGLDQDETNFLDEVSRQQYLLEKQTRDEEMQELLEYRISFHIMLVKNIYTLLYFISV